MIRGNLFHRRQMTTLATLALTLVAWAGSAESAPTAGAKGHAKAGAVKTTPAIQTAIRYAEALSQGDRVTAGQLDFACQYRFVTALQGKAKQFAPSGDAFYDACWQTLTDAYAPMLKRSDIAMDILWPSAGPLVFFGDDLPRAPASTFVADVVGISPPGSGLHVTALGSRTIPSGSFKLTRAGKVLAAPTTLVQLAIQYQDPLTSPVSYAAGNVKWTNTIKRPRRALKSMTTQWGDRRGRPSRGRAARGSR